MNKVQLFLLATIIMIVAVAEVAIAGTDNFSGNMSGYETKGDIYSEVYAVSSSSVDSSQVVIMFRVPYSALNFISDKSGNASYFSVLKAEIAYKNSDFIIKKRISFIDTVKAETAKESNSSRLFYVKSFLTVLPQADYSAEFELTDNNNRQIWKKRFNIMQNVVRAKIPLIFSYRNNYQEDSPTILDSAFDIRNETKNIFIPIYMVKGENSISYKIYRLNCDNKKDSSRQLVQSGSVSVSPNMEPGIISKDYGNILKLVRSESVGTAVVKFADTLMLHGNYVISYSYNLKQFSENFSVRFLDCPVSLSDERRRIAAMQFLMNEEEFSLLKSADNSRQMQIINAFFADKDPKPETAFNEAIEEYFRRVDYAATNFYDSQHGNGSATSRGKIYLLYGSPDAISSQLSADKNLEIWEYTRLNKKVIFSVSDGGIYKLEDVQSLK